jgi:uncharacterized protein YbcI
MHQPDDRSSRGTQAAAISDNVVRLMSDYTGRGPTKAKTYINHEVVTVVLKDGLTKGERSLAGDGKSDIVLRMRQEFQRTMREDLVASIEEVLHRRVIAFMSANHIEPDMAVEVFVMEPDGDGQP